MTTLAVGACGCNCVCHGDEGRDWPGPCAACCEPGMDCDCGRALAYDRHLRAARRIIQVLQGSLGEDGPGVLSWDPSQGDDSRTELYVSPNELADALDDALELFP